MRLVDLAHGKGNAGQGTSCCGDDRMAQASSTSKGGEQHQHQVAKRHALAIQLPAGLSETPRIQ
jgi:hypothetical protein